MTNERTMSGNDYLRRCESALETLGLAPMFYIKDRSTIVPYAMQWLANELDDLHVEYHSGDGWQVSTLRVVEEWGGGVTTSYGDWIRDEVDGTLAGALLLAVEKVSSGKKALAASGESGSTESSTASESKEIERDNV